MILFWKQFKNRNLFTFETNLFSPQKAFDDMLNTIWCHNILPDDKKKLNDFLHVRVDIKLLTKLSNTKRSY